MRSVYIRPLPGKPILPLLYPNLGREQWASVFYFERAFDVLREPIVRIVEDPKEADFILLAHNYPLVSEQREYLREHAELASRYGKPIIVFWHGDRTDSVDLPHATVFRTSQYRYRKRENEVIMPAYTEDVLGSAPLSIRKRASSEPVVGFCGWVDYTSFVNHVSTSVKNVLVRGRAAVSGRRELLSEEKGITIRQRALLALERNPRVRCSFIRRGSYSGSSATIGMDPAIARKEYVDNLRDADYALTIKGDGNYSARLYEALSMGRVPLFVDTAMCLPLEDVIDYDAFLVRVPLAALPSIGGIAADHFRSLDDAAFEGMQTKAREAYERYLRVDAFLSFALGRLA